jgi:KaiC/GvpD/RAD55 family RecA-like ATPase
MRTLGWDPAVFEQGGKLAIVDAYSSTAAVASNEKYWVKQPFSLSELGIAISTAVSAVEPKPRVFLDSTVTLFTRLEPARVVEFLQDRAAQTKGVSGIFFFAVGKGTLQTDHLSRLEEIVDCIIELDLLEKEVDVTRQIRIKKLRGRKFEDRRLEFNVVGQKGIVTSQEALKKD